MFGRSLRKSQWQLLQQRRHEVAIGVHGRWKVDGPTERRWAAAQAAHLARRPCGAGQTKSRRTGLSRGAARSQSAVSVSAWLYDARTAPWMSPITTLRGP